MLSQVALRNVGLKFKTYTDKGATLKETIVNKIMKRDVNEKKEFWALRDINLSFTPGERVGIIGNNGAGKSTLLKLISKIYEPSVGTIATSGRIAPLIELGAGFNPELSGYENIFLNGAVMGIPKRDMESKVASIIEFTELHDFIHTPVKYYSTGMYGRLAFAIATEISPDILIIDEIFAGGDINFVKKAEKRMNELMHNSQVVLMVSHSMGLIEENCNRVIIMEKGSVVGDGEPAEMIRVYKERNQ